MSRPKRPQFRNRKLAVGAFLLWSTIGWACSGGADHSAPTTSSTQSGSHSPSNVLSASASNASSTLPSASLSASSSAPVPAVSSAQVPYKTKGGANVLFDKTGGGLRIFVLEKSGIRCLRFSALNGGDQSCMEVAKPDQVFHEYIKGLAAGFAYTPAAKSALMVGLGGGSTARMLGMSMPHLTLDVVELEPLVIEAAQGFFEVHPSERLHIHQGDGRAFIEKSEQKWDVILLDAFGDDYIPFPLATVEFLRGVEKHLSADGAVASNLWYTNDKLFRTGVKTFLEVFPTVYVFKGRQSGNAIVVATREEKHATKELLNERTKQVLESSKFPFDFKDIPKAMAPHTSLNLKDVQPITDEKPEEYEKLVKAMLGKK